MNEKFKQWFEINKVSERSKSTRSHTKILKPVNTRTKKFQRSSLPFLTSLLNEKIQSYDEVTKHFSY